MSSPNTTSHTTKYPILFCLLASLAGCTAQIENAMERENTRSYERGEISSEQYGINQSAIKTLQP